MSRAMALFACLAGFAYLLSGWWPYALACAALCGGGIVAVALPMWWEVDSCLAAGMQAALPTDDAPDGADDADAVPVGWFVDLCPACRRPVEYTAPAQGPLAMALHRLGCERPDP